MASFPRSSLYRPISLVSICLTRNTLAFNYQTYGMVISYDHPTVTIGAKIGWG